MSRNGLTSYVIQTFLLNTSAIFLKFHGNTFTNSISTEHSFQSHSKQMISLNVKIIPRTTNKARKFVDNHEFISSLKLK